MAKRSAVIELTSGQMCCPSVLDAPLDAAEAAALATTSRSSAKPAR